MNDLLKRYSETLPEANSESILESCRNSAGIGYASWFRQEIDRSVLEKLIEMAEERTLKKVLYGKPTRKKFGIRKYRKYAGSPRK